jgi:hypothetical protein
MNNIFRNDFFGPRFALFSPGNWSDVELPSQTTLQGKQVLFWGLTMDKKR